MGTTDIVEQAADANALYNDARNQRSTSVYYPETAPEVQADKIQQVTLSDGRSAAYVYEQGTLTIGSQPDVSTYVFTPNVNGSARRTIVTQGPATSGKTTRSISLYDAAGNRVLSETQVYENGSGYSSSGEYFSIEWFCTNPGAAYRLREVPDPCPECGGILIENVSVARNADNEDLPCGTSVYVHEVGVVTVQDTGGGLAMDQLDHYAGTSGCNGTAGTIGEKMTIRLYE